MYVFITGMIYLLGFDAPVTGMIYLLGFDAPVES